MSRLASPLSSRLLRWYRKRGRVLPWRKTTNAYRIFISELMLQQTQVERVVPKYQSFITQFPNWKSLAEAKSADIIHAWAGLGYNRRVLYARKAAQDVVRNGVPESEAGWRKLKGVGPYMAAALTEFASGKRAIVIDTNIRRVIGRTIEILFPTPQDNPRIRRTLERETPLTKGHVEFPQALMDLANAVCTIRRPACSICPLQKDCRSAQKFLRGDVVRPTRRRPTERMHGEKPYPDRIYRGRILAWIRLHGAMKVAALGPHVDPTYNAITDQEWIQAMIKRLIKDGLLDRDKNGLLQLPKQ